MEYGIRAPLLDDGEALTQVRQCSFCSELGLQVLELVLQVALEDAPGSPNGRWTLAALPCDAYGRGEGPEAVLVAMAVGHRPAFGLRFGGRRSDTNTTMGGTSSEEAHDASANRGLGMPRAPARTTGSLRKPPKAPENLRKNFRRKIDEKS